MTIAHHTPTSTTAPADSFYVRNLCALWRSDPRLAMAIEAVHSDDVPAIEAARDGSSTIKVGGVYLHSRYRPIQEAEAWADSQKAADRYAVVVSGFGLGHHIRALFDGIPEDALLIVAEPHIPLLKAAFCASDFTEMLSSKRLMIFTSLDRGTLVERLEPRTVLFTSGAGTLLASHPASVQIASAFHNAFQKLITEFIAFTRTGMITLMLNNVATCRNIANNIGRYATTPPIDVLHNAFMGRPAILVAAGPSLQKNMHLLHEIKGDKEGKGRRAVIIAVQTMLKPLLAAGIDPDFVTSLDYNTVSTRFFENLEESGSTGRVHLVAQPTANWNVLDVFAGTMSLTHHDFAAKLMRGNLPERKALKAGATVAHLSFYLAEFLGCDPIILTGQDLGFVDGLYYKPGTAIHETWGVELSRFNTLETKEWERIVRSRTILRKIPDVHGHPMYTEEQFFVYLQQFERDFAASRCRVIDATEGGARKQHVTVMPLREAIDSYCKDVIRQGGGELPWKNWQCSAASILEGVKATLEKRRTSAVGMQETCIATIPLLKQMVENQTDEAKMNRLFVDVDRMRGKVGEDPATFEMVCHLNTIGELRRHQADLGVKGVKPDSLERQKRQLLRDIEYVGDLQTGCERLLAIVDEATARIDRQLAAVRAGRPWPREVAGSSGSK